MLMYILYIKYILFQGQVWSRKRKRNIAEKYLIHVFMILHIAWQNIQINVSGVSKGGAIAPPPPPPQKKNLLIFESE